MTNHVYILLDGGHDYSPAAEFGELHFCLDKPISREDIPQMYHALSYALKDAISTDFLLVSSLTSMCMIAASILSDRFGQLHLLTFEGGTYRPHHIYLSTQET